MLAAALMCAAAVSCTKPTVERPWHQETGYRWRDLDVVAGDAGFTSMSPGKTGVAFENNVSDSTLAHNRYLAQGGGVALGDVDGDGRVDIFLAKTEGCSALYRNLGNWKFEDITKSAGVGACDRHSTGAAFIDIDGDGDLDLVLLATNGPNAVFLNDGKGHFTERRDLGLDPKGSGGTTIAAADVDGTGWLDMYVANYKPFSLDDSLPPSQRAFNRIVRQAAPGKHDVAPEYQNDYKVVMRPDMGGLRLTIRGAPDQFYKNDHGRLTPVPLTGPRFLDAAGRPVPNAPESFGLSAHFADLNGDGFPDLYVTNDFEDTDQLWWNDGQGHFRLADWTAQRQMSNSAMGADAADINGDGRPDLFEVDMRANDSRRLKTQMPTHTALPKKPGEMALTLQHQRNSLFLNRGDGTFAEVSAAAGVAASGWSWSTMFMDVDLDGWQDILVANGHRWDLMDADTQEGMQNSVTDAAWRQSLWLFPKLALTNVAFRNRGDLTFEDASAMWKFGVEPDISNTMAAADLDGDGDLDVVVNRLRAPALLLRNDARAPRVAVRLVGDAPNTRAVGAMMRLRANGLPLQQREVVAGGLYMSHSDYLASFAMGKADTATLEIDWRDGRHSVIHGVRPNRLYEITTATAAPGDSAARHAPASGHPGDSALFEDATRQLGGHSHVEDVFDDWDRQYLLPFALSQLGPGVAWFDLDRDGYEDLLIGSGKGGRLSAFHNDHGRLTRLPDGPAATLDFTGVLGMSEANHARVLAGVSTWEARSESLLTKMPAVVGAAVNGSRLAQTIQSVVGSHEGATGPIALGDYDGDGYLDLFVGSRAIPLRYPDAASSGLFHNDGRGHFVIDTANSALLRGIGLVSAATFADINGDGHPDLLLARDWGSIVLLINDGHGRFTKAPPSWGLDGLTSEWNGIAVGDFDGDGRLDIVATSWGRNVLARPDSARPLLLAYGPFGARGEEEMLLAQQDDRLHAVAPVTSYERARLAMNDLASRIRTFGQYADATLDQVLGGAGRTAGRLSAATFDHTLLLNRGDHFEAVPLPLDAQLAPAFYAGVADFDGDGNEDLFITQNFFPTAVGTPRYDAGRSLLMLGDGHGHLTSMSGDRSGLTVYGDQRGAAFADYDHDGRTDLVVSQNGAQTRLFHNRGAKPGLRVRLIGPPSNPDAVGSQIRLVYGTSMGPVREVQAGSGYWSQNGAAQVMGMRETPTAVWVRWPGGAVSTTPVAVGAREIVVASPSKR